MRGQILQTADVIQDQTCWEIGRHNLDFEQRRLKKPLLDSHQAAVEALLLKLREEKPQHHLGVVTFGAICERYIEEELPARSKS